MHQKITILDFGSQYTQLIARKVRELDVFSEIVPYDANPSYYADDSLIGIILSGGPASVLEDGSPLIDGDVLQLGVPVLGICYGMQLIALLNDGEIARTTTREYGRASLNIIEPNPLFEKIDNGTTVWMSHGDHVDRLPKGFSVAASTETLTIAAFQNKDRNIFGLQFHPEVHHTEQGRNVLRNFLYNVCGAAGDWSMASFVQTQTEAIRNKVAEDEGVILGLSGGVDSAVTAALLDKAIGERTHPVFVNNGLLRLNEAEQVRRDFEKFFGRQLIYVDASETFLRNLQNVEDPEKKRKIIGGTFIDVFTEAVINLSGIEYLAQGTLYPDVIESVSTKGPSATIKSHHNVGGLPEKLGFELIEPLRELFKDEVRKLGEELGLPHDMLWRHPFPGPGLAVRIIGAVTEERLDILRIADHIFISELRNFDQYDKVWQAFAVLLPVKSVGVMGDERTYENVLALRAVNSVDGMTADWSRLPEDLLARCSTRIINEVKGVNRVCYDISSKPPSTIEWE